MTVDGSMNTSIAAEPERVDGQMNTSIVQQSEMTDAAMNTSIAPVADSEMNTMEPETMSLVTTLPKPEVVSSCMNTSEVSNKF